MYSSNRYFHSRRDFQREADRRARAKAIERKKLTTNQRLAAERKERNRKIREEQEAAYQAQRKREEEKRKQEEERQRLAGPAPSMFAQGKNYKPPPTPPSAVAEPAPRQTTLPTSEVSPSLPAYEILPQRKPRAQRVRQPQGKRPQQEAKPAPKPAPKKEPRKKLQDQYRKDIVELLNKKGLKGKERTSARNKLTRRFEKGMSVAEAAKEIGL